MQNCKSWPEERVGRLRECWRRGRSAGEIAALLGVTRNAVIGKVNRLRLTRPEFKSVKQGRTHRASRPKPPAAESVRAPQADDVVRVWSVLDLESQHCRYPIGEPQESGFGFCGDRGVPGASYCREHLARCHAPAAATTARKVLAPTAQTARKVLAPTAQTARKVLAPELA